MSSLVSDIGCFSAFMGGFLSFFSVWQLCLFQITPFFLSFAVAFHLTGTGETGRNEWLDALYAAFGYTVAFSIVFGALGIRSGRLSEYLRYNLYTLKSASALYVGLLALWLFFYGRFGIGRKIRLFAFPMGAFLGASLAIVYLPCITPTMSEIMNFGNSSTRLAGRGRTLLTTYALGLSCSFVLTGILVSAVVGLITGEKGRRAVAFIAALILLLLPLLLVTGWMMSYKTFLVGIVL